MTRIILQGVVGSTAYGLANEDSDIDRLGIFVRPTADVLGIHEHKETIFADAGDEHETALHEVKKFCNLALKCNPTISELLWLTDYETLTDEGRMLLEVRGAFLSARAVRASYIGYAVAQSRKLVTREAQGMTGFTPSTSKRRSKHARHLWRLCLQCEGLLKSGEITLDLGRREEIMAFGEKSTEDIVAAFEEKKRFLDSMETALPDVPDYAAVNRTLLAIRAMN